MTDISQHDELEEKPTTRRNMLRWAGAAAVGGVVATIAADPAAAGIDGAAVGRHREREWTRAAQEGEGIPIGGGGDNPA